MARSAPVASDARSIGIKPAILSSTDQPASAIYESASADSCAVLVVLLPASRAADSSFLYVSDVASTLRIPATFDIDC